MRGLRCRRVVTGGLAAGAWLLGALLLAVFGGAVGTSGTAAAAQYEPPPPPTTVLSGLSGPADVAADSRGTLWFVQGGGAAGPTATLYSLAKGAAAATPVYSASGGNGTSTPYIFDLGFDSADFPHFVQWTSVGGTIESSVRRLDPATGGTTILTSETGASSSGDPFVISSGSILGQEEIGADGTVYWSKQTVGPTGNQEARLFRLQPASATPDLLAEYVTPGVNHTIADFVVAGDGAIYFQRGDIPTAGGSAPSTLGIYRLAPGGSAQPIRAFVQTGPNLPRPLHLGLDGQGNLIVGERIFNGFVRQGCAESTTYRLVRFDAASLATPSPPGTVYSTATYPDFNFVFVGSSSYFRVSPDGGAFFNLLAASFGCSTPPGPFALTHIRAIAAEPGGTQHVLYDDAPSPPAPNGFYSFAVSGNDLFVTSWRLGTLWQFPLKDVDQKPKKPK